MSRKVLLRLLGAAFSVAVASGARAAPGNGNGNGGVGNGNGNGNDNHETVVAPEINPAGLAAVAALLLGGVALITARSSARKGRAANG
jgi:hypothetical protein